MKRAIAIGLALALSLSTAGVALAADRIYEPGDPLVVVTEPVVITDPAVVTEPVVITDPAASSPWLPPDPPIPGEAVVETAGSGLTGTYVGPPGRVRYIPAFQYQLIRSDPMGAYNCAAYSAAMAVDKATYGGSTVTGRTIRSLSGVGPYVGLTLLDVVRAADRLDVVITNKVGTWTDVIAALRNGQGVILQGDYDQIPDVYSGQPTFDGNHGVYVDMLQSTGVRLYVMDPLQRVGARWIPISIMRNYAQKLARAQGIYPRVFYAVIRPMRFFQ